MGNHPTRSAIGLLSVAWLLLVPGAAWASPIAVSGFVALYIFEMFYLWPLWPVAVLMLLYAALKRRLHLPTKILTVLAVLVTLFNLWSYSLYQDELKGRDMDRVWGMLLLPLAAALWGVLMWWRFRKKPEAAQLLD